MVEQCFRKAEVAGSSPVLGTISQPRERRFTGFCVGGVAISPGCQADGVERDDAVAVHLACFRRGRAHITEAKDREVHPFIKSAKLASYTLTNGMSTQ